MQTVPPKLDIQKLLALQLLMLLQLTAKTPCIRFRAIQMGLTCKRDRFLPYNLGLHRIVGMLMFSMHC